MVTTQSMRYFAADCLKWATETADASHRQLIVAAACSWAVTAEEIDRLVDSGRVTVASDLRSKLN